MTQQATHIQRRLDRQEAGKEAPTKVGYTRHRKPKYGKRPGTKAKPQSWRGKRSKPKYGLQLQYNGADFGHSYTRTEWARLKRRRKIARASRRQHGTG